MRAVGLFTSFSGFQGLPKNGYVGKNCKILVDMVFFGWLLWLIVVIWLFEKCQNGHYYQIYGSLLQELLILVSTFKFRLFQNSVELDLLLLIADSGPYSPSPCHTLNRYYIGLSLRRNNYQVGLFKLLICLKLVIV